MGGTVTLYITAFGLSDEHVARQVIVVIQQNVGLDAALGSAKLGPWEQLQAQRNGGRIEGKQLVLETELLLALPQSLFVAEAVQSGVEQILVQLGGPVFVGVREGGFIRRLDDTKMHQFAQAAAQTVADFAERIGMGELAEQHRDQLGPAAKTLGGTFRVVFLDQRRELGPRKMLEQLIEETRDLYDDSAFLVGTFGEAPAKESFANVHYRRAFLLLTANSNLFWTRVVPNRGLKATCPRSYGTFKRHVGTIATARCSPFATTCNHSQDWAANASPATAECPVHENATGGLT